MILLYTRTRKQFSSINRRDLSRRSLTAACHWTCREIHFRVSSWEDLVKTRFDSWFDRNFPKFLNIGKRGISSNERIIRSWIFKQRIRLFWKGNWIVIILELNWKYLKRPPGARVSVCNPESRLWRKCAEMARAVSTTLSFHRVPRLHWRSSINYTCSLVDTLSAPIPRFLEGI